MGKGKNLIMTQVLKYAGIGKPDPKVWVFSSVDNCHYNYNSRYLFEYVKDHLKNITPYFVINDSVLREQLSKEYGEEYFIETESAGGIRKVLKAGVWFTSAGLPVYGTRLGKERLIINLWHGVPLKKIALLDPNLGKAARIYFKKIFSDNYTYVLTTSKALVPVMSQSFAVEKSQVKVWGQPRNDRLFSKNNREEILGSIYGELPRYRKAILYAPTFRDGGTTKLFPFQDFNPVRLQEFLKEREIILFLRTHIKERTVADAYLTDRIRFLGNEEAEDVTGILNIFDVLVTDYSSIYIDYLVTGKPVVFLPYDKDEYLHGRGMNFHYDDVTPGPKPDTMEDFLRALDSQTGQGDSYQRERLRVNSFFNEINEPCAENICRHVLKMKKIQETAIEDAK